MTNIPVNERRLWVGASESAALFGVSPYLTKFELFHMKAGEIPPHDLDRDERVNAGQFLEPSIAAWASNKWHWPIRNVAEYTPHPTVPRFGCSLDFEAIDGAEPVEIKNVDNSIFRDPNNGWETEGTTLLDAPVHFLIQVQHQLACRPGPDRGWLVVCVGGNRLYRMEVPRHPRMIERLEAEVAEFWRSVEAGEPPDPDFQADAQAIALLYGGRGDEWVDLRDDERARELCAEYLDAHEQEKAAKKRKTAALAEIKTRMHDARGALIGDGFRVKASHIAESTSVRKAHWRLAVTQQQQQETKSNE